ncbi:hypothetical protein [Nostoc sp. DSM 114167]|uniref:hypothetical protein n=1 Tax=Nostoc sp. DSM 114167 TaxID=3439050 RepID=UPI00404646CE
MKLKPKITIADHFAQMSDPRIDRTKRHKLIDVEVAVLTSPTARYLTHLDSSTHYACVRLFFRIQRV